MPPRACSPVIVVEAAGAIVSSERSMPQFSGSSW
jgi:hypothetical protein